jgi:hypothetical protein
MLWALIAEKNIDKNILVPANFYEFERRNLQVEFLETMRN